MVSTFYNWYTTDSYGRIILNFSPHYYRDNGSRRICDYKGIIITMSEEQMELTRKEFDALSFEDQVDRVISTYGISSINEHQINLFKKEAKQLKEKAGNARIYNEW